MGIVERRPLWLYASAVLFAPMALYLGMTPRFRYVAWLLPLFQVAAALQVRRSRRVAGLLLAPVVGVCIWLGALVWFTNAEANSGGPTPPKARVLAGDAVIPAALRSYSWTARYMGGGMATAMSPPEFARSHRLEPVPLQSGSVLRFAFDPNPYEVRVQRWMEGQGNGVPVPVAPGETIRLPRETGVYVYEVSARWGRGTASYVFVVEVGGAGGSR